MNIDEKLEFGKYKGLTVQQIFQGVSKVDKFLIEKYINEKLNIDYIINPSGIIGEILSFEISETLIRATPFDLDLSGNYEKSIAALFKKGTSFLERIVGNISFEEFIAVKKAENTEDKRLICGGSPDYINWCINKIDWFYIHPIDLEELQKMPVFRFKEMEVIFKTEDIYSYKPHFISENYSFPANTIIKNNEKHKALEVDDCDDDEFEQERDSYRDYFNAMTDGQLGGYEEFEGNSDDLDNWVGR